jgi:hypothetical protein
MLQLAWVLVVSVASLIVETQDDGCSQNIGGLNINLSQVPNAHIDGTIAHPCLNVRPPFPDCHGNRCSSVGKSSTPPTLWTLIEHNHSLVKFQVQSHQKKFQFRIVRLVSYRVLR